MQNLYIKKYIEICFLIFSCLRSFWFCCKSSRNKMKICILNMIKWTLMNFYTHWNELWNISVYFFPSNTNWICFYSTWFSHITSQRTSLLAYLSWKLKWAFLIPCCWSSVRLSVSPSDPMSLNMSHVYLIFQNKRAIFNLIGIGAPPPCYKAYPITIYMYIVLLKE